MSNLDFADVKSIIQSLKDGIKQYRNEGKFKEMLDNMVKFYQYSFNNQILILSQKPEATYCGSMKFWNSLGRYVSKGEHGIKILCPNPRITTYELKDKDGNVILDEEGKPKTKSVQTITFSVGNTFDISQTYGKELKLNGNELVGEGLNIANFLEQMKEIAEVNDVRIDKIPFSKAKGYFVPETREIVVREGMSDLHTTKTVVHESAHALVFKNKELVETLSKEEHEIVAESVAYVVCKRFGLDTSDYSFSYVNGWAREDDSKIEKCVDFISNTSKTLIERMEDKLGLKKDLDIKKDIHNEKASELKNIKMQTKQKSYRKELKK